MSEETQAELAEKDAQVAALEERLAAVQERLATLLQLVAEGKPLGGALVGRHEPYSAEVALGFAKLIQSHDRATGSLWEALRTAGFDVIELPESVYGALTPETR